MVTALVDSSVLVDVLRGYDPAVNWLAEQGQLAITPIVWLELLEGAPNKIGQQEAIKLLRRFEVVDLTPDDMQLAIKLLTRFGLSHNVDAFDCLIASVHLRLKLPLYTRNIKHFAPLIDELAVKPYT